jgi:glycosyltransferase involved in cell wall biosynthesis
VIASDFPLWKTIIEGNNCGICVNPFNPVMIADAINRLIHNPEEAESFGKNGRNLVRSRFNWELESEKLEKNYSKLS